MKKAFFAHTAICLLTGAFAGHWITDLVWFKNWQDVCYADVGSWPCDGLYRSGLIDLIREGLLP